MVSVVRLALIPVLWWWMATDHVAAAGWLLGVIGATDWIDGYLARRLNQVSEVGKFLDPLADRLAVGVAVIGGLVFDILPDWFAWAIIIREAIIGVGALGIAARARAKLDVRRLGKIATALLYLSVAWYFVGKGSDFDPLIWLAWATGLPGLALYYIVGFQYLQDAVGLLRISEQ
ncbi:MAG: CDP-alcohol phosphatidyltransferase family protein [Acidimicrobiia bacterium]|nr:CDP-alcohol phosphatidyltransferase family protein [Acidimicrobiia bacterium]